MPPGQPSQVTSLATLPDCNVQGIMGGTDGHNRAASAQLGWVNSPRVAVTYGSSVTEIVPSLPCSRPTSSVDTKTYLNIVLIGNVLSGSDAGTGHITATVKCYWPGGTFTTLTQEAGSGAGFSGGSGTTPYAAYRADFQTITVGTCPQIAGISVSLTHNTDAAPNTQVPIAVWAWQPLMWKTGSGGWTPATSANGLLPPGVELPIVCGIDNTGADIIAITQNVMGSIINWVPCMLIPVGWDRADMITTNWNTGPVGQLTAAYKNAVPSGIACGSVGYIPFFGQVISFDTCQGDFAPGWVKSVVGWVIVLGLATLIVRRLMWSVGSKA